MPEDTKNDKLVSGAETKPPEPTDPPAGAKPPETEPGPVPYARFKEINDQLAELRTWRKTQEKAETERTKQADADESARLAEQQKFEELAEKRQAKITELQAQITAGEAVQTELERYQKALGEYVTQAREGIPEHVLPLLDKLDPIEQIQYLTENRENLTAPVVAGVPSTPRPSGETIPANEKRRKEAVDARKVW